MLVFDYGKLREVRRALHLKQSDTAAMMKCTAATISNIEMVRLKSLLQIWLFWLDFIKKV